MFSNRLHRYRARTLNGLFMALCLGVLTVFFVAATPAAAEGEVVVEGVQPDGYPRMVVRFSLVPAAGSAPADLASRHVSIADEQTSPDFAARGPGQAVSDVYPIGRAADGRGRSYEAVWVARLQAQPGATVHGRIVVAAPGLPQASAELNYLVPILSRGGGAAPRHSDGGPASVRAPGAGAGAALVPTPAAQLQAVPLPPLVPAPGMGVGAFAAGLAGIAALCVLTGVWWRASSRHLQDRLTIWVTAAAPAHVRAAAVNRTRGRRQPTVSPLAKLLARGGARLLTPGQSAKLRHSLVLAGQSGSSRYTRFVALKVGLGLSLFVLACWIMWDSGGLASMLLIGGCLAVAGFVLPNTWLRRQIKARQYQLRKALPDALDLMTIGVSAGLAFDGAVAEIVEKWDNALSHEFGVMLGELRMGTGRRDALLGLSYRTDVEEIHTVATQIIQSEELGMSLTDTLLTIANQMRIRRRQQAEEQAHKAAIKMLIPLVFLIFPALFVVILGPSVPALSGFVNGGP